MVIWLTINDIAYLTLIIKSFFFNSFNFVFKWHCLFNLNYQIIFFSIHLILFYFLSFQFIFYFVSFLFTSNSFQYIIIIFRTKLLYLGLGYQCSGEVFPDKHRGRQIKGLASSGTQRRTPGIFFSKIDFLT